MPLKSLVVFYSYEGHSKLIAEAIADEIAADILELKLVKEVKSTAFMKEYLGHKQVQMKTTPLLKQYDINLNNYDLIILGTPIWAGTFSPAMRSFLTQEKIEGKKIALFYCFAVKPGRISIYFKEMLKKNIILSEFGCKDPLNQNTERAKELAKSWARSLIEKLQ
ncbi:MAG: flavodoxin family protein [Candidatus Thorarchaeota archaeon]